MPQQPKKPYRTPVTDPELLKKLQGGNQDELDVPIPPEASTPSSSGRPEGNVDKWGRLFYQNAVEPFFNTATALGDIAERTMSGKPAIAPGSPGGEFVGSVVDAHQRASAEAQKEWEHGNYLSGMALVLPVLGPMYDQMRQSYRQEGWMGPASNVAGYASQAALTPEGLEPSLDVAYGASKGAFGGVPNVRYRGVNIPIPLPKSALGGMLAGPAEWAGRAFGLQPHEAGIVGGTIGAGAPVVKGMVDEFRAGVARRAARDAEAEAAARKGGRVEKLPPVWGATPDEPKPPEPEQSSFDFGLPSGRRPGAYSEPTPPKPRPDRVPLWQGKVPETREEAVHAATTPSVDEALDPVTRAKVEQVMRRLERGGLKPEAEPEIDPERVRKLGQQLKRRIRPNAPRGPYQGPSFY